MRNKDVLERAKRNKVALTYDDVRLQTGYSEVMPDDVNLESKFSRNVKLKVPIVSAAMDTVTEHKLAIEMAKLGGLGVIHRNLTIEEQAFQVTKVKHHLNGLIEKPICVREDERVEAILNKRERKGYNFHSFPVLNKQGQLVGMITETDFEFCEDLSLTAREIMTEDPLTASREISIEGIYNLMKEERKKAIPLTQEDGKVIGMYVFSDVSRIRKGNAKDYNLDSRGQLRVGAAIGTGDEAMERVEELSKGNVDVIVIDTAHADTKSVHTTLEKIKRDYSLDVVVGNVSVGESAKRLTDIGADGIKVGQGPGSICTTRIVSGIGRPQVSAIYDCVTTVKEYEIPICADGGLRNSGDIPIAIAAGAHSVMLGTMLAGTKEAPGEIVFRRGRQWKSYRGMGSLGAMQESKSSRERYLQTETEKGKLVPEGVEGLVEYRGELGPVLFQYLGGLRKGMGYVGAKTIEQLREKGEFDKITSSGLSESHPHDIDITQESPNYPGRS